MGEATTLKKTVALILCLAACYAAAGVGVPFTARATGTWYAEIDKPAWTPPSLRQPTWRCAARLRPHQPQRRR